MYGKNVPPTVNVPRNSPMKWDEYVQHIKKKKSGNAKMKDGDYMDKSALLLLGKYDDVATRAVTSAKRRAMDCGI